MSVLERLKRFRPGVLVTVNGIDVITTTGTTRSGMPDASAGNFPCAEMGMRDVGMVVSTQYNADDCTYDVLVVTGKSCGWFLVADLELVS